MKSGFNHFDIVYFINLECRPDRLTHIQNELNKTNIDKNKIHHIHAVHTPHLGHLGCVRSHIIALQKFLETNDEVQHCLILEDDFHFIQEQSVVNQLLDDFFHSGLDYDVLMISGNIQRSENTNYSFFHKVIDAQTASGYCVNKKFASILLENFKHSEKVLEEHGFHHEHCCDITWKKLQPNNNWYIIQPKIGKQMKSYSNIENTYVDYGC